METKISAAFYHQTALVFQVILGHTRTSIFTVYLSIFYLLPPYLCLKYYRYLSSFLFLKHIVLIPYFAFAFTVPLMDHSSPGIHLSKLNSSGRPTLTTHLNKYLPVLTLATFYHITLWFL